MEDKAARNRVTFDIWSSTRDPLHVGSGPNWVSLQEGESGFVITLFLESGLGEPIAAAILRAVPTAKPSDGRHVGANSGVNVFGFDDLARPKFRPGAIDQAVEWGDLTFFSNDAADAVVLAALGNAALEAHAIATADVDTVDGASRHLDES